MEKFIKITTTPAKNEHRLSRRFVATVVFLSSVILVQLHLLLNSWRPCGGPFFDRESSHFQQLDNELLAVSKLAREQKQIPRILHQTWKNNDPPPKYASYRNTWLSLHPDWTHHLWTDVENRLLVAKHYPWFLPTYDAFPIGVERCDAMRYIWMHRYGGMYADLDMEPMRNLDFLFDQKAENASSVILAYMECSDSVHTIPPAWMMSQPGHHLWLFTLMRIMDAVATYPHNTRPEYLTGPALLHHSISAFIQLKRDSLKKDFSGSLENCTATFGDLRFLEPGLIYPYHWKISGESEIGRVCSGKSPLLNETACKALFPKAYAIQYSGYSWGFEWENFLFRNYNGLSLVYEP